MKNPFVSVSDKNTHYISANCSINRLIIKKLPLYGIEDSIEGKAVSEIFSTPILIKEIEKHKEELNIEADLPKRDYPYRLEKRLSDENVTVCSAAEKILKTFGSRLGLIFLTLKTGEKENREARLDWSDEMWEYWANVKDIIMVGGLASGLLGKKLRQYAYNVFSLANVEPYNFILFENASIVGVMGCASAIKSNDGASIVLDAGHTNIKRSLIKKSCGEFSGIITLPSVKSEYMDSDYPSVQDRIEAAKNLHKYLLNVILDTYREGEKQCELSDEIIISIANYVVDGKLDSTRGGFSKLSLLFDNYAECLSEDLSGSLKRKVSVRLVHDATAVAIYFSDYKDSVCITMGTAFGVSFTGLKF